MGQPIRFAWHESSSSHDVERALLGAPPLRILDSLFCRVGVEQPPDDRFRESLPHYVALNR
jgi:hypothetical protein